jgi:hypothetical protein
MTNQYDYDDHQAPPTSMANGNHVLQKAEDSLNDRWQIFVTDDDNHWQNHDLNQHHIKEALRLGGQDMILLLPLWASIFLDVLIFHSLASYLILLLLPGAPAWTILLATCLFPFVYMLIELKFAQLIHIAHVNRRLDPFNGWRTFWVIFWYVLAFCLALFPSAVFAYVMHLSQEENQLSWIFVVILALLGVITHLMIVFGGESVIEAKDRRYILRQTKRLSAKRLSSYRSLRKIVGHTKGVASHYAGIAQEQNIVHCFMGLSNAANSIITFVDEGYYNLHPKDRPPAYHSGAYRPRSKGNRLPGDS